MPRTRLRPLALACGVALAASACGPVSAALHDPHALPALAENPRVRFDNGAQDYAHAVAALLPRAMAKVEAAHGRPFGRDFVVAAYLDDSAYAAANGRGDTSARGVAFLDRVTLSPQIWRDNAHDLEPYLTHELSHEHLLSRLSLVDYLRIPVWFTEGIAVMASDGGGAQLVSEQEAKRAIAAGRAIATPDEAALFGNVSMKAAGLGDDMRRRMHMAYRQAGLFVSDLRARDGAAFASLMDRLYAGERFKPAFEAAYGSSVAENWSRFAQTLSHL